MRNKVSPITIVAVLGAVIAGAWGCAEVQQAAEDAARRSGNERLARGISGAAAVGSALIPLTYEEERAIGQAIALQVIARSNGLVQQPELTRYVNLVGRAVAEASDRPDIPYHFAVLSDDSINAFAAPAGYVFITRGLLKQIRNEAELAAVLGHEIAHVSEKHILKIIQRSKGGAGFATLTAAAIDKNPEALKNDIDLIVKIVLEEGLDQSMELEADALGDAFAVRVGYDPTAYVALLTRLRSLKGDDRALFKTHPDFSARINAVQSIIQSHGWKANGTLLADRFGQSAKI
jgi:predicted Zn-dependent protease